MVALSFKRKFLEAIHCLRRDVHDRVREDPRGDLHTGPNLKIDLRSAQ